MKQEDFHEISQMLTALSGPKRRLAIHDALIECFQAGARSAREAIDRAGGPQHLTRCAACRNVMTLDADVYTGVCGDCRKMI